MPSISTLGVRILVSLVPTVIVRVVSAGVAGTFVAVACEPATSTAGPATSAAAAAAAAAAAGHAAATASRRRRRHPELDVADAFGCHIQYIRCDLNNIHCIFVLFHFGRNAQSQRNTSLPWLLTCSRLFQPAPALGVFSQSGYFIYTMIREGMRSPDRMPSVSTLGVRILVSLTPTVIIRVVAASVAGTFVAIAREPATSTTTTATATAAAAAGAAAGYAAATASRRRRRHPELDVADTFGCHVQYIRRDLNNVHCIYSFLFGRNAQKSWEPWSVRPIAPGSTSARPSSPPCAPGAMSARREPNRPDCTALILWPGRFLSFPGNYSFFQRYIIRFI